MARPTCLPSKDGRLFDRRAVRVRVEVGEAAPHIFPECSNGGRVRVEVVFGPPIDPVHEVVLAAVICIAGAAGGGGV